jgi:hypothetical protein
MDNLLPLDGPELLFGLSGLSGQSGQTLLHERWP